VDQDKVIDELLVMLNAHCKGDYRITRRPDKENRRSKEIDAYAEANGRRPLAIEHTSIESFTGQKLDSARFVNVLGPLESELEGVFEFRLDLTIRVASIVTGVDWRVIRESTKKWLLRNANNLPFGRSKHTVPGVPFELAITKHPEEPGKVWIARFAPSNEDTQVQLAVATSAALRHKYEELTLYKAAGAITILIVESDDIALASPATLYAAYYLAARLFPPVELDQVWFACTYVGPAESLCNLLCFRGPQALMDAVNRPNAMFGPQHDAYWNGVVRAEPSLRRASEDLVACQQA